MIKTLLSALLLLAGATAFAGDVYVSGYYRANGTYVQPHYRTSPDSTSCNNYGTFGNYNPHTGLTGTRVYQSCPTYNYTYTAPVTMPSYTPTAYQIELMNAQVDAH